MLLFYRQLQSDHLVQLYGVCETPDLLIVTEFMEEGMRYISLLCYYYDSPNIVFVRINIRITILENEGSCQ